MSKIFNMIELFSNIAETKNKATNGKLTKEYKEFEKTWRIGKNKFETLKTINT